MYIKMVYELVDWLGSKVMVVVLCTLFARKWESCQINMARNALEDLSSY
jgi:hypothetical protein